MTELNDQLRDLLPRLRRFALSLTRDVNNADDLVQATLERALARWKGKRADGDLRAWLFSILYRRFIDGHRSARRYARMLELFSGREDAQPSAERTVMAEAALGAFDLLKPEQRALLFAITVEGLSYQQAADMLGIPIGTVMSRLSRARKALHHLTEGEITPPLRMLK
ncbi:sigma-70 family RNA polymerase sigma factor [Pseudomonas sp. RIT-PI-S]|uniref:sigma-70 family RNA polymerase sigma factor n=1 Tax=Pseudomonas sp. RIT-PI-S TaxID=3035295 RepID=UPI0021D90A2B|nr:sigma-70 family RNA polymerase sigma factor [Pseudomonas sp. RIT-PI-S]